MNIIMVGCGKVGTTLLGQLSKENHNITVIDINPDRISTITNEYDVMGLCGNGVSYQTLTEAGIKNCQLLIAVTGSDEQNLLCCMLAKRSNGCKTIAQVRDPIYANELHFLKEGLELAMIINPAHTAASEIARVFQFPNALKIDSFSSGTVELYHFRITADSPLCGQSILQCRNSYLQGILVCTARRGEEAIIPDGQFVFKENDTIGVVASRKDAIHFLKKMNIMTGRVHNALIVGGGNLSFYLAKRLIATGISTTIVDHDFSRCEELSAQLPEATILHGDPTEHNFLEQLRMENYQGVATLTGMDEENILLSLYAKEQSEAKIITKINRISFRSVISSLNLDTVINPQVLTADTILKYIRSMNKATGSDMESLYTLEDGMVEAIEFSIKEASAVTGVLLKNLKLKRNTLICSISRKGRSILPSGSDTLEVGDRVILVMANRHISDIREILA